MIKDTSSRNILITALVLIVLQGANLVGVAVNRADINSYGKKIDMVYVDYVPMWFLEGIQQNMNYQTQEIVATIEGDKEKVKEINQKYIDFQKTMLNNLAQMRGGYTTTTRSGKPKSE